MCGTAGVRESLLGTATASPRPAISQLLSQSTSPPAFTSAPLSLTTLLGSHAVLTYQDQARMSMSAGYVAMLLLQSIFGNSRLSAGHIFGLLKTAFLCLVVGLLEAIAIATALAERKTDVKPSREILGLGLANLASAAFMGCPATGSFARSAVNKDAGAASGEIAATCCCRLPCPCCHRRSASWPRADACRQAWRKATSTGGQQLWEEATHVHEHMLTCSELQSAAHAPPWPDWLMPEHISPSSEWRALRD